jgi:hypothetical protein
MIKVFTSDENPDNNNAGNDFTQMIDKWLSTQPSSTKITNIHSNSNQYGWMIIIQYEKGY